MKTYKKNENIIWRNEEFGEVTMVKCRVLEVHDDHVIARSEGNDSAYDDIHFWIDDDNDENFLKVEENNSSDLTHLFEVGQKVRCKINGKFYKGTVKETYEAYIIVDIPEISSHRMFGHNSDIGKVYPEYNF